MSYIVAMDVFQELMGGQITLSRFSKHEVFATEDPLHLLRSIDVPQKAELLAHQKSAVPYEVEEPDEGDPGLSIVRDGPNFETLLGRHEFAGAQPETSMLVEDITVVETALHRKIAVVTEDLALRGLVEEFGGTAISPSQLPSS